MPLYVASIPYKRQVIVPIPSPTATGWDDMASLQHWANDLQDVTLAALPSYIEIGELRGYTRSWKDNYVPQQPGIANMRLHDVILFIKLKQIDYLRNLYHDLFFYQEVLQRLAYNAP